MLILLLVIVIINLWLKYCSIHTGSCLHFMKMVYYNYTIFIYGGVAEHYMYNQRDLHHKTKLPSTNHLHFIHLADAFIQIHLQMRKRKQTDIAIQLTMKGIFFFE